MGRAERHHGRLAACSGRTPGCENGVVPPACVHSASDLGCHPAIFYRWARSCLVVYPSAHNPSFSVSPRARRRRRFTPAICSWSQAVFRLMPAVSAGEPGDGPLDHGPVPAVSVPEGGVRGA